MMRYVWIIGQHVVVIRLPIFTEVFCVFWVSEIDAAAVRRAASRSLEILSEFIDGRPPKLNCVAF